MSKEDLLNGRGGAVWRLANFANPRSGATMEVFIERGGKQANTMAEKEKMLTAASFPMNHGVQNYELHPAGRANERITKQVVQ